MCPSSSLDAELGGFIDEGQSKVSADGLGSSSSFEVSSFTLYVSFGRIGFEDNESDLGTTVFSTDPLSSSIDASDDC